MPNGNIHKSAGAVLGPAIILLIQNQLPVNKKFDLEEIILSSGVGFISSRIPDILEPANNPNHRAFFHSFVFGGILCMVGLDVWNDLKTRRNEQKILGIQQVCLSDVFDIVFIIVISAILLHLVMDGFTKKSLPFV